MRVLQITITNASIDKQITLKRDYVYKIENTDLEIGVLGVLLRILLYFEAPRCSRQTGSLYALRINLLNIMIQKTLLRGRGTSIIMKLNESNKEVKIQKKKKKKEFSVPVKPGIAKNLIEADDIGRKAVADFIDSLLV